MAETLIDVADVGTALSTVIDRVRKGEEFSITQDGKVIALLLPVEDPKRRAGMGMFRGEIWMSPDFDDPLTDQELQEWGY